MSNYYWIGNKYKVERKDAPNCKCHKPCKHYAKPNKPARRLLRRLAKTQNSKVGQKLLGFYDQIARITPKGSHPHKARQAKQKFGLVR